MSSSFYQIKNKSKYHFDKIETIMNIKMNKQKKISILLIAKKIQASINQKKNPNFNKLKKNIIDFIIHKKTTKTIFFSTTKNKQKIIESKNINSKNVNAFQKSKFAFIFFRESSSQKFKSRFFDTKKNDFSVVTYHLLNIFFFKKKSLSSRIIRFFNTN